MKKLIVLIIFALSFFAIQAQESATYDGVLAYNESYLEYEGVATDILTTTDTLWYYTVLKRSFLPLKYDVYLNLDVTGGSTNSVTVTLVAKKWLDQAAWTTLKTVTWTGGADTTIVLTESSTAGQYQYYKVNCLGANNTMLYHINYLYYKFWN